MDRRLFGFVVVLTLLVVSNTVLADRGDMDSRRYQSVVDVYAPPYYSSKQHRVRKQRVRWQSVGDFRTRRHHISEPIVGIDRRVSAIQLEGLKRTAYVRRAFVATHRGRMIRVPELEGRLVAGTSKTVRLHKERYITSLVLEVDSRHHKRSYVRVKVRSPENMAYVPRGYRRRY
jgi:hypothetical protein